MLLESGGGGWISPHLLDHLKTLWKTKKKFFDFLKVHNELGKVTKFWTSKPLFHGEIAIWKSVGWFCPSTTLIGLSPPRPKISKNPIAPCHNSFFGGLLLFLLKYDLFEHSKPLSVYDGYALFWPNLSPLKTQKWLKNPIVTFPKSFLWLNIIFMPLYVLFKPSKSSTAFQMTKMRY